MKKTMVYLVILLSVFFILGATSNEEAIRNYYEEQFERPSYETVKARVLEITFDDTMIDKEDIEPLFDIRYQHLKIEILKGDHKGKIFTVNNTVEMLNPQKLIVRQGDIILLNLTENEEGEIVNLRVYDLSRESNLYLMIFLFCLLLAVVGGMQGLKSMASLVISALVLIFIFLPLILRGLSPVLTTLVTCVIILGLSLLIISGKSKKTLVAFLGGISGLIVAAILAVIFGSLTRLTGVANEEAKMLAFIPQKMFLDYQGILFSGMIIGALGAVMDVTLSIASAMSEIISVKPNIKRNDLIKSGFTIGKDIMGSMSNTLILAYVGGSIHIMLIFITFKLTMTEIINLEIIASEIIRAMAGSIGLIASIPITAFIGGYLKK